LDVGTSEFAGGWGVDIISKTLTFRVFQPFLFTLGRRYDKADTFFQMLSKKVSALSYRRPRVKRKGWKTRKVRVFEMMCWM
jgi:hypothetical protein